MTHGAPLVASELGLRILAAGPAFVTVLLLPACVGGNYKLNSDCLGQWFEGDRRSVKLVGCGPGMGVWLWEGRYRPLLLDSLVQAPGGKHLPLVDLTGRFVDTATGTPFTSRTRPSFAGVLVGGQ